MKKFVATLSVFAIPLFIFIIPPSIILRLARENYFCVENVLSDNKPYLIGYAYNEKNYNFIKWQTININNQHEVMALGSSRVLQFRNQMFAKSFYNAGYTVSTVSDFKVFLNKIPPSKYPKYLIINLDQWMFNPNWNMTQDVKQSDNVQFELMPDYPIVENVWRDLFSWRYGPKSFNDSDSITRVGLNAFVNQKGFRRDGSMYYGQQIQKLITKDPTADDYEFSDTSDRIKKGVRRFQYGQNIDEQSIFELKSFLEYCTENNIYVVGFLPPFSEKIYTEMKSSGRYTYISKIYPTAKEIFETYSYELYDFTDLMACGSNDGEAIDGFHGGEKTYLRMLISMLESGSKLNEVCDVNKLKKDLLVAKNNYLVYDDTYL